ncbi:hypothetical protein PBRA_008354 [Plasmodiophora brassicae]|nr:hypothetical protein PBRA_008354 [Plasmodiophora brassicae]
MALPQEIDSVFSAAIRYYFRGESLHALRGDDRLQRSEEGADNYGVGGYHRVTRGQLYNQRYMIVSKLGWGHFSTVWLAADLHQFSSATGAAHVALKIQKGEASYMEAALDEVKLLKRVSEATAMLGAEVPVTQMRDSFMVVGDNGKHMCTVFEVLGDNLLELLKRCPGRRLPLASVKVIARDILKGLDFLHRRCRIIHTDLKPENVLVASSDPKMAQRLASGKVHDRKEGSTAPVVKIADLGNACWTDHHFTDYITTRQYRSPEIILKAQYDCSTDIWSLGCMCFELITGEYLFDPKADRSKGYTRNDDHLALMLELMGPAPPSLIRGAASDKYFDSSGRLCRVPALDYWPLHELLRKKYRFSQEASVEIAAFLRPMLHLDPARRVTAEAHLRHPWLRNDSVVLNMSRVASASSSSALKAAAAATMSPRSENRPNGKAVVDRVRRSQVPKLMDAVKSSTTTSAAAAASTRSSWRGSTTILSSSRRARQQEA